jgi:glutathione S-transferase
MQRLALSEDCWSSSCLLTTGIVSVASLTIFYQIYNCFHYPGKIVSNEIEFPPVDGDVSDSVVHAYLFQGDGKSISSSPFSTKLSAYLRLTGIPHTVQECDVMKAPKGKVPYIIHYGQMITDSQLIIRYLENTFDVLKMSKENSHRNKCGGFIPFSELSPQDKALCEMIRLTCEGQLYWAIVSVRWLGFSGLTGLESNWHRTVESYFAAIPVILRSAFTSLIRVSIYNNARGYGLSRHSAHDQCYLVYRSLDALSAILDKKTFFLGETPTECDCIAFGTLEALCEDDKWPNPLTAYLRQHCYNLMEYYSRMRATLYPDLTPPTGKRFPPGVQDPSLKVIFKQRTKSD